MAVGTSLAADKAENQDVKGGKALLQMSMWIRYAVLAVVLANAQKNYNLLLSIINGAASGLGFTLAIVLFASMRERVDKATPPECFKGAPISLIAAGLMALAFMGFSGMRFS